MWLFVIRGEGRRAMKKKCDAQKQELSGVPIRERTSLKGRHSRLIRQEGEG
jgi:hypothetical protein